MKSAINFILSSEYHPFDALESDHIREMRLMLHDFYRTNTDRNSNPYLYLPTMRFAITASAICVNRDFTKVLTILHKLHGSYRQPGGHADGDKKLSRVAANELRQETDYHDPAKKRLRPAINFDIVQYAPIDIVIWNMTAREKNGIKYPDQKVFDIAYLFVTDEDQKFTAKKDEVIEIGWMSLDDFRKIQYPPNSPLEKLNPHQSAYFNRIADKVLEYKSNLKLK